MGSKKLRTTLGELCVFKGGSGFSRDYQGHEGLPHMFIKVSDMNLPQNGWKIRESNNTVTDEMLKRLKAQLQPAGATVFAKIGEALKADRTRLLIQPTAIDNNMMAAIPKRGVDPLYLYYLLTSLKLSTWAEGSALPYLKQTTLAAIDIAIPTDKNDRLRIAAVLKTIDNLIDSKRQTNDYLAA